MVDGWRDRPGPVFLVEGASDTLALTAAGLSAVGRPSNTGGCEHLTKLLAHLPSDREIVVVGENDKKESGEWPGREGAERVSATLTQKFGRPVGWVLPPDGVKDVRAWLTARVSRTDPADAWAEAGRTLSEAVVASRPPSDRSATA